MQSSWQRGWAWLSVFFVFILFSFASRRALISGCCSLTDSLQRCLPRSDFLCRLFIFLWDSVGRYNGICARLCHFNILGMRSRTRCAPVCVHCAVCNQCRCEWSKLEANGIVMSAGVYYIPTHATHTCMQRRKISSWDSWKQFRSNERWFLKTFACNNRARCSFFHIFLLFPSSFRVANLLFHT